MRLQLEHIKINYLILSIILILLAFFIIQIFYLDLAVYGVPGQELITFYYYSIIYTVVAVLFSSLIRKMRGNKERISQIPYSLNIILGGLWILDGVLQFQPQMPYAFLTFVIKPSIVSINNIQIQNFLYLGYNIWATNPFQFDALSGALQIFIGYSFLINRSERILKSIAIISIVWALIIWIFGEGFGGIPEIGVSILTGFPGSALLYVILAIPFISSRFNSREYLQSFLLKSAFFVLVISLILQLIPVNGYWNKGIFSQLIFDNTFNQGESPLLYNILNRIWPILIYHTQDLNIFLSLLMISSSFLIFSRNKIGYLIQILFITVMWILFQNMGIYDNPATDFNSGIVLALIIYLGTLDKHLYVGIKDFRKALTENKIR